MQRCLLLATVDGEKDFRPAGRTEGQAAFAEVHAFTLIRPGHPQSGRKARFTDPLHARRPEGFTAS